MTPADQWQLIQTIARRTPRDPHLAKLTRLDIDDLEITEGFDGFALFHARDTTVGLYSTNGDRPNRLTIAEARDGTLAFAVVGV